MHRTLMVVVLILFAAQTAAALPASLGESVSASPRDSAAPDRIYAEGEGAMPDETEEPNRARAYLQAKAYAKMQAIANLAQAARGTMITYCAVAHDYIAEEQITQQVSGIVSCVEIVSESTRKIGQDTIVTLKVCAPVPERWSTDKPADAKNGSETVLQGFGPPWTASLAPIPAAATLPGGKGHTSVIVDAQGLGLVRSMSPKILRRNGAEVWGTVKVDLDFVTEHGIVAYACNLGQAYACGRAGANPLVLRARSRGPSSFRGDIVLSDEDADRLLAENRRSGFLTEFRVIFVIDPL